MGFFAKLFKKNKASSSKVTTSKQSQQLQDELSLNQQLTDLETQNQEQLLALLSSSKQEQVQLKIVEHLEAQALFAALKLQQTKVVQAAQQRLSQLLQQKPDLLISLQEHLDIHQQLAIVALSGQEVLQQQVIAGVKDQQQMFDLATNATQAAVRQLAAEQINDEHLITALLKASKTKDKVVYRIAKAKSVATKVENQALLIKKQKQQSVFEALQSLSQRSYDPQFSAKLKLLESQWLEFDDMSSEQEKEQVLAAIAKCHAILEQEAEAELQQQKRQQAIANLDRDRESICSKLQNLIAELYLDDIQNIDVSLADLASQWSALDEFGQASKVQSATYLRLTQGVESLSQEINKHGTLESIYTQLAEKNNFVTQEDGAEQEQEPEAENVLWQSLEDLLQASQLLDKEIFVELVSQAKSLLEAHQAEVQQQQDAEQQLVKQMMALIRKGNDAIKHGHLRRAGGIAKSIAEKQAVMQEQCAAVPEFIISKVTAYQEDLAKLQDWQSYAVLPKKEALLSKMQDLVNADMEPQELSEHIKELQQEWKNLSKGGQNQHQELWEQFNEIAQKAYQPCKEYFEQLAQLRVANLEQRQALANDLSDYANNDNWEGIDWKAVDKLIKVALTQWRSFSPVDRQANKPVQKQFDKALNVIKKQLNAQYDLNIAAKEALVKKAAALESEEDLRLASQEVKNLQAQWQEVGLTPRAVDQKLWQNFRTACNKVFERRSEQSSAFKAELQEHKQQALKLIEQVKSLCSTESKELASKRDEVEQVKQAFEALGALPKVEQKQIQSDFSKQVDCFYQALKNQQSSEKNKKWQDFFLLGESISAYELAMAAKDAKVVDELEQKIEQKIATLENWPSGGEAVIRERLANSKAQSKEQQSDNEKSLRTLCIRMEILKDKASPAEDQALRMEYQVERLQQGIGQAIDDEDTLKLEWLKVAAVDSKIYKELYQRFSG